MAQYGSAVQHAPGWSLYRDNEDQDDNEICNILSDNSAQTKKQTSNAQKEVPLVNPKPNKVQPAIRDYHELHQVSSSISSIKVHNGLQTGHKVHRFLQEGEPKFGLGPPPGFGYSQWEDKMSVFSAKAQAQKSREQDMKQGAFRPFRDHKDNRVPDDPNTRSHGRTPGPSKHKLKPSQNGTAGEGDSESSSNSGPRSAGAVGGVGLERLSPGPIYMAGGPEFHPPMGWGGAGMNPFYSGGESQYLPTGAPAPGPGLFQPGFSLQPPLPFPPRGQNLPPTPDQRHLQTPDLEKQFAAFEGLKLQDSPEGEFAGSSAQFEGLLAAASGGTVGAHLFGTGSPIKWYQSPPHAAHGPPQYGAPLLPQPSFDAVGPTLPQQPRPRPLHQAQQQRKQEGEQGEGQVQASEEGQRVQGDVKDSVKQALFQQPEGSSGSSSPRSGPLQSSSIQQQQPQPQQLPAQAATQAHPRPGQFYPQQQQQQHESHSQVAAHPSHPVLRTHQPQLRGYPAPPQSQQLQQRLQQQLQQRQQHHSQHQPQHQQHGMPPPQTLHQHQHQHQLQSHALTLPQQLQPHHPMAQQQMHVLVDQTTGIPYQVSAEGLLTMHNAAAAAQAQAQAKAQAQVYQQFLQQQQQQPAKVGTAGSGGLSVVYAAPGQSAAGQPGGGAPSQPHGAGTHQGPQYLPTHTHGQPPLPSPQVQVVQGSGPAQTHVHAHLMAQAQVSGDLMEGGGPEEAATSCAPAVPSTQPSQQPAPGHARVLSAAHSQNHPGAVTQAQQLRANSMGERGHRRGHRLRKDGKYQSGSAGLQEEVMVQEPQPLEYPPQTQVHGHAAAAWGKQPARNSGATLSAHHHGHAVKHTGHHHGQGLPLRNQRLLDEIATKRAELVESPTTRLHFKEFYRQFRAREKTSFEAAKDFALTCFDHLPQKVHWRLYLEIAELSKRENRFQEARDIYRRVCNMQPYACQGWLEYSKLEEECGNLEKCSRILQRGLMFCHYSESLLIKAIKHEERLQHLDSARELLSRLKRAGIEKVWRTVLEGALLEARAGNTAVARKIFRYLMQQVPWYGPIYYEAFRLEEKNEHFTSALQIIERGLAEIPRYGPLWFGAFRLCERIDMREAEATLNRGEKPTLRRTTDAIARARESISKELVWKVHFEAAQIEERLALLIAENQEKQQSERKTSVTTDGGSEEGKGEAKKASQSRGGRGVLLSACRRRYAAAALACPANLRWKVWLAGARTELAAGVDNDNPSGTGAPTPSDQGGGRHLEQVRHLLNRAFQEVPDKSRSHVFLECSRVEEFAGRLGGARRILSRARAETRSEWKVFLESVLLEVRAGDLDRAVLAAESALGVHSGTGRLWAVLVALRQREGDAKQLSVLRRALREVPKSGEVWCEGARVHLNPCAQRFDLEAARRYLEFAIQFTPQYGDSFMECLRLELISKLLAPRAERLVEGMKICFMGTPCCKGKKSPDALECSKHPLPKEISNLDVMVTVEDELFKAEDFIRVDTKELELRCVNADPNYGSMWFHCRQKPSDTARSILWRAKSMMALELQNLQNVYIKAIARHKIIEKQIRWLYPCGTSIDNEVMEAARSISPIGTVDNKLKIKGEDFVTGLVRLNRITANMSELHSEDKRKILFGSDQIVP